MENFAILQNDLTASFGEPDLLSVIYKSDVLILKFRNKYGLVLAIEFNEHEALEILPAREAVGRFSEQPVSLMRDNYFFVLKNSRIIDRIHRYNGKTTDFSQSTSLIVAAIDQVIEIVYYGSPSVQLPVET